MNQPNELAEQIHNELENNSFKSLISRFRNIQNSRNSTQLENVELLYNASLLTSQLQKETENCQEELSKERSVTSELHRLLAEKRKANSDALHQLEIEETQLRGQLALTRQKRIEKLRLLDEMVAEFTRLQESDGFNEEQQSLMKRVSLLSQIPINVHSQRQLSIEERWQGLKLLVESTETPFVPLMQEFPELAKTFQSEPNPTSI